ncbi:MAG: MBL fold metallo-hydrolase [Candidatus Aenigmarchaeota archaeon]|nr:MBL fold metallo-hydrolase [Candidatus Aenigmarchaeota archaeon]
MQRIMNGLYAVVGSGKECNIYIIDGEVIVDAGTGNEFARVKEFAEKNRMSPHTLVNTHYHYDHTGGNAKLRDLLKCAIAIHEQDADYIKRGETLAEIFGESARASSADLLLEEGDKIETRNFSFEVLHTPGHTKGSICLYEKEKKILISGDTVFDGAVGRTDLPGGSSEQLWSSMGRLSDFPVDFLLPGHGPVKVSGVQLMIRQMLAMRRMEQKARV